MPEEAPVTTTGRAGKGVGGAVAGGAGAAARRSPAGRACGSERNLCRPVGFCYFGVMEPSTTAGRKGSLANPEVREDGPGHVIPILQREFDDFVDEAEKYLDGQTPENEFIGFRLKQGVYGQRQADEIGRASCRA